MRKLMVTIVMSVFMSLTLFSQQLGTIYTKDSEVSDNIVRHLFDNFEYLSNLKWKTNNNTYTHFAKVDGYYIFVTTKTDELVDMKSIKKVEAEGGELVLSNGDSFAIIPKDKRKEALEYLQGGCDDCLNSLINSLPRESDYAEDGTLIKK